jgi:hypothetical protein
MLVKIRILCFFVFLTGLGLFFIAIRVLPDTSPVFPWCIGLACALIILGLGYFINSFLEFMKRDEEKRRRSFQHYEKSNDFKEKSGYLVCKIMSILLCIYLLILNTLMVDPFILFLGIALVVIQYILDLTLQIYYANRKEK